MNETHPQNYSHSYVTKNGVTGVSTSEKFNLSWTDTRAGSENPGYRKQISTGLNATTNFSGSKSEVLRCEGSGSVSYWSGTPRTVKTNSFSGFLGGAYFDSRSSPAISSADNAALASFYRNARAAQTSVNGLTVLGELRETLHMLRHPAEALRSGIGSYLSRVEKHAKRSPRSARKALAGTYLEYAFGWMPLLSDVSNILEAYNRSLSAPKTARVQGFGSDKQSVVSTSLGNWNGVYGPQNQSLDETVQVIYRAGIKASVTSANTQSLSDLLGFRLDEFAPTVWELLPWSFMADYFTNIGDIVSAASYARSSLTWCCKTVRTEKYARVNFRADPVRTSQAWGADYVACSAFAQMESKTKAIMRTSTAPGIPSLEVSLPGRPNQIANIGALIAQSKTVSKLLRS